MDCVKVCLHVPTPFLSLLQCPSKFNIVLMVTGSLTGQMGDRPILPVKLPVTIDIMLNRVTTAQGKQGIWFLLFPDRENTANFVVIQGKFLRHRENFLTVFINAKSMFLFTYFQKNLAMKCPFVYQIQFDKAR